jgi:uncharacterized OB-fold protein
LTWTPVSGTGTVHTFTVTRQPIHPAFADETPQVQAIVELDEGIRLTTTLVDLDVDLDPDAIEVGTVIGLAVEPVFDDGPDGITLLRFRPTTA